MTLGIVRSDWQCSLSAVFIVPGGGLSLFMGKVVGLDSHGDRSVSKTDAKEKETEVKLCPSLA